MKMKRLFGPLAGLLLCATPASAETIGQTTPVSMIPDRATLPAIAGHAWVASDQACFHSSWSSVRNSCSTTKKLLIAGRNSAQTTTVIAFSAAGENAAGGIPPVCRAVVNDPVNGLAGQTGAASITPGPGITVMGSISVSPSATFHFDCDITADNAQGFGLALVGWSPGETESLPLVTSPAFAGHAWLADKQSCFTSSWSTVWNTCATTQKLLVPLNISIPDAVSQEFGGGWGYDFWAAAENDASHSAAPTCRAIMNDAANFLISATPIVTLGKGPTPTYLGGLSANGGSSHSAHLDCDITARTPSGLGLSFAAWGFSPTL
jgi:hypothetical protein